MTLTETCAECGGQGTIHETWDCGAGVDSRCDFCNGTGEVPKQMFTSAPVVVPVTSEILKDAVASKKTTDLLNEALAEVYKRRIEANLFTPSSLLEAYKQEILGDVDGPAVQS